ncbi:uncharacterized protein DS421_14g481810 [Arachis hypogaea]|nr:uncharacterized protein DS421_14g481810 [Arachis hypogaea]
MKEYKVHSSWTLYQIPCKFFQPLCLSRNGDIIGRANDFSEMEFYMYNLREERLQGFKNPYFSVNFFESQPVYTESLATPLVTLRIRIRIITIIKEGKPYVTILLCFAPSHSCWFSCIVINEKVMSNMHYASSSNQMSPLSMDGEVEFIHA